VEEPLAASGKRLRLSYVYCGTNDLQRAIVFYTATLGALGMRRCVTSDPAWDCVSAGWGAYEDDGWRELAFWSQKKSIPGRNTS
jgi:catechol 2,3-dioxygenase-like lactoylglutathione lyase family enzyme